MIVQIPEGSKPYMSYAVEQGKPETLVVKFHTSMPAAKRQSVRSMADVRDASKTPFPLCTWGYAKIDEHNRKFGHVV